MGRAAEQIFFERERRTSASNGWNPNEPNRAALVPPRPPPDRQPCAGPGGLAKRVRPHALGDNPDALRRWQLGLTGYPLVDVGMREFWTTGWMHNRLRMVSASS